MISDHLCIASKKASKQSVILHYLILQIHQFSLLPLKFFPEIHVV